MSRVLVGLLNPEQEFQQLQAREAREAAGRLGLEVEAAFAEHAVAQIQQLFSRIHAPEAERPAAIVVETATAEGLERVARNAVKAGVGWILLNVRAAYVDELREASSGLPIAMVGADQRQVGRIQGRQVRALVGGHGAGLVVQGPANASATADRMEGLKETLATGFELRSVNGEWTEASGERAVAGWLRLKTNEAFRPDVVVSQNDAMAIGARRALAAGRREWTSLPFLGCDGLPEGGLKMVADGRLAATVVTPPNTGRALELVADWLKRKQQPPREVLIAPSSHPPETQLTSRSGGPAGRA